LSAHFFDGRTPDPHAVTVSFAEPGFLVLRDFGTVMRFPLSDIEIRPQLAGQPAKVELPDRARLEVDDAEAFYAAFKASTGQRQWQHALESHWAAILAICLLTFGVGYFVYSQAVPMAAKWTAALMPADIERKLGQETLSAMARSGYGESALSQDRQQRISAAMYEVIETVGEGGDYKLVFRGGKNVRPNAFALPGGTIVFTDAFVRLAKSTDELRTIMAHELGHARNHHVMRMVLQKSLLAGLITVVTGDVAAAGSLAIAVPRVLLEASYSRDFEYEADAVAKEYLLATGKPLTLFADIMGRLESSKEVQGSLPTFLSTHPATAERIKKFLE
jgi:Zn-dependent protease with chaperone function